MISAGLPPPPSITSSIQTGRTLPERPGRPFPPCAPAAAPPPAEEPTEPSPFSTIGGNCITTRQAGALRGMALNRCTELGLTEADARQMLIMEVFGCDAAQVTEDMYEAAKSAIKEGEVEF